MTEQVPPDLSKMKLDFSGFHPLDHSLLACRGYPGGRRTHLRYRWEFQWRDRLIAATRCRLGRHKYVTWYRRRDGRMQPQGALCTYCGKDKPE